MLDRTTTFSDLDLLRIHLIGQKRLSVPLETIIALHRRSEELLPGAKRSTPIPGRTLRSPQHNDDQRKEQPTKLLTSARETGDALLLIV